MEDLSEPRSTYPTPAGQSILLSVSETVQRSGFWRLHFPQNSHYSYGGSGNLLLLPGLTFTTMMTLPCLRPTATAEAVVSLEVLSVVMISRSCILSTGEK